MTVSCILCLSAQVVQIYGNIPYNVHRWLKVEYKVYDGNNKDLKIHAEPNTTGKSRTLYVELYTPAQNMLS